MAADVTRTESLCPSVLSGSEAIVKAAKTPAQWAAFAKKYRAEMSQPDASHALSLLAALSHSANFSVGCYCADETHCHRSVLRELLAENGAALA